MSAFNIWKAKWDRDVIPFPGTGNRADGGESAAPASDLPQSTDEVLAAFATMSRRISDLARELKCLGYFDDDNDHRPRAA